MAVKDLLIDLVIRYGFQVLGALVVLAVGAMIAQWVGTFIGRWLGRYSLEPPVKHLIVRVARLTVLLFAVVVALDKFGFQIAPLVAGIGVAGLGIGFALQGVLSNVFAGLTIIFTKPFRVGEYIEMVGVSGDVHTIALFSTTLVHADQSRIIIPNRKIVGEILHNFGTTRQLHLTITVPHTADLTRTLDVARAVVLASPRVLKDPAPLLGIAEVGELGIKVGIHPWVRVTDVGIADPELYEALIERFRAVRIGVPLAQHEVRLFNDARS